jgi:hypothetical protein
MASITFAEQASAPSTPSSGNAKLYVNTTPRLVLIDDAGAATIHYAASIASYTPEITGSTGNPTITYTTQVGRYHSNGLIVNFTFVITINTFSGGTGDLRVSLPVASLNTTSTGTINTIRIIGPDVTGTPVTLGFQVTAGQAYGTLTTSVDNGAGTTEPVTILAAGDTLVCSGFYFIA